MHEEASCVREFVDVSITPSPRSQHSQLLVGWLVGWLVVGGDNVLLLLLLSFATNHPPCVPAHPARVSAVWVEMEGGGVRTTSSALSPLSHGGGESATAAVVNLEFVVQEHITGLLHSPLTSLPDLAQRNRDIQTLLRRLHASLKSLEQLAMGQDSELDKAALLEQVKVHQAEYNSLHAALRRANMACGAAREKRQAASRAQLLEGSESELRRRKERAAEDAARAQEGITTTLRRTRQKMYDQALRGAETIQSFKESSDTLGATLHQHRTYGTSVRTARSLLTKLRRRECTDMLLVLFGVFFFLSVVLYISLDRLGLLATASSTS